jgi:polyhydroxyalkanoate synthesis regulator phasin/DNA-directed RNA polymerase subunit RPC12/RpoP
VDILGFMDDMKSGLNSATSSSKEKMEDSKLKNKISDKKAEILRTKQEIGEMLYTAHKEGTAPATPVEEQYAKIDALLAEIDAIEEERKEIAAKFEEERKKKKEGAAAGKSSSASAPAAATAPASSGAKCSECGSENPVGTKFCKECGKKIEAPPAPAPAAGKCPDCGTDNPPNTKFCKECGKKLEAPPAPPSGKCPDCGNENAPGTKFCNECGKKLL